MEHLESGRITGRRSINEAVEKAVCEFERRVNAMIPAIKSASERLQASALDIAGRVNTAIESGRPGVQAFEEMTPSEIETVWNAFREVNASFFGLLGKVGIVGAVEKEIKTAIQSALNTPSVSSFPEATLTPGSTDGASS